MEKHKHLLDMLVWENRDTLVCDLVQAARCPLNPGIPDHDAPLEAYIYINDILASAVLGWEFQFLVPISGTPIVSGIPIPFSIPKIPVGFFF